MPPSQPPTASSLASEEKARAADPSIVPSSRRRTFPDSTSHRQTAPRHPPASTLPSDEKASDRRPEGTPASRRSTAPRAASVKNSTPSSPSAATTLPSGEKAAGV